MTLAEELGRDKLEAYTRYPAIPDLYTSDDKPETIIKNYRRQVARRDCIISEWPSGHLIRIALSDGLKWMEADGKFVSTDEYRAHYTGDVERGLFATLVDKMRRKSWPDSHVRVYYMIYMGAKDCEFANYYSSLGKARVILMDYLDLNVEVLKPQLNLGVEDLIKLGSQRAPGLSSAESLDQAAFDIYSNAPAVFHREPFVNFTGNPATLRTMVGNAGRSRCITDANALGRIHGLFFRTNAPGFVAKATVRQIERYIFAEQRNATTAPVPQPA